MSLHRHTHKYSEFFGCLLHVVAFILSSIGIVYSLLHVRDNGDSLLYYRGWPGKFKYLTFWNMIIQPSYFLICIINDLFGGNITDRQHFINRSRLHALRDNYHASCAFPMGIFVVTTFWGLYAVDRELVFPKALDKIVPAWQNQLIHTSPLIFLLTEKIFVNIQYPSKKRGMAVTLLVAVIYQIWILWIAYSQDIWTYPVLKVLSNTYRALFLATLWVCLIAIYFIGHWLSKELWWAPAHHAAKKAK